MVKKLVVVFLLLTICGSLAFAADNTWIDRTTVSGMNIFLQKTKSEVIDIALLLKSGSGIEPCDKKGTAQIMNQLVEMKLSYGPAKVGFVGVYTFPDYTLVTLKTIPSNLHRTLQEIKELLSSPLYDYDIISDLKKFSSTSLKDNSSISKAYYEFNQEFYGKGHPYNDYLDPEVIPTITGADVYKWYRQTYQPGNAILSITGQVDESIGSIEKEFSNLMTESVDHRLTVRPVLLDSNRTLNGEDPNGRIASICIGFAAPRLQDPEYPAFRVLAYYLGEYMHYFEELRVKEGLFYWGDVLYNYLGNPKAPNIVFLAMTDPENVQKVEIRTLDVVRELTDSGIEQSEIAKVVAAMVAEGKARTEEGNASATLNALSYYLQNQLLYDENLWPKLKQVTTADIQKAAAKYFKYHVKVAFLPKELPDNF